MINVREAARNISGMLAATNRLWQESIAPDDAIDAIEDTIAHLMDVCVQSYRDDGMGGFDTKPFYYAETASIRVVMDVGLYGNHEFVVFLRVADSFTERMGR